MAAEQDPLENPFHKAWDKSYLEFLPGLQWDLPAVPVAGGYEFQITRYMVIQVLAVVLAVIIFRGLAQRIRTGEPAHGRWWNFWEMLVLFVRDQIVRPAIGTGHHHDEHHHDEHGHDERGHGEHGHDEQGHGESGHGPVGGRVAVATAGGPSLPVAVGHPADKYLPFVWTIFFYVLFNNVMGAIPVLGSPTAAISMTAALAITTLCYVIRSGVRELGVWGYLRNIAPGMDPPFPGKLGMIMGLVILVLIWGIEFFGLLIKHAVLAIRLFAVIMAGHTLMGVILSFIVATAGTGLFFVVAPASVLGQVGVGLLELFFSFLQAYVFALLASLFIGMAVHPH